MLYSLSLEEAYEPNKYYWPVFSIKNYVQDKDGWFHYRKKYRKFNKKNV